MKAMRAAILYVAIGLAGGFAVSAWLNDDTNPRTELVAPDGPPLERRVAHLESRLDAIAFDNTALRAAIEQLDHAVAGTMPVADAGEQARRAEESRDGSVEVTDGESSSEPRVRARQSRSRGAERNLAERLTDAGFAPGDAQHIERRVEELRMAAMQSRYEALRNGESPGALDRFRDGTAALRSELGDADYERFLEATGRSTRVDVASVLAGSPAQAAGLEPGDQILAYAGARVFDIRELNQVLLEGEPGEPVVVDVERDGQPIQLVMPRGPLGIASGSRRRGGG